jgi:riboflavin synthase
MFTGIIEQTAVIKNLSKKKDTCRLTIRVKKELEPVTIGDSVSVNGACLTVVDIRKNQLTFDIMRETFRNSSFSRIRINEVVNIERSLKASSRIEGHFVLGHIDKVQRIKSIEKRANPYIDVTIAPGDKIFAVKKGSIAIDGISLTIGEVYKDIIRAYIIPHTLSSTNLRHKQKGDPVNIEFDILNKYMHKNMLCKKDKHPMLTEALLKKNGFI